MFGCSVPRGPRRALSSLSLHERDEKSKEFRLSSPGKLLMLDPCHRTEESEKATRSSPFLICIQLFNSWAVCVDEVCCGDALSSHAGISAASALSWNKCLARAISKSVLVRIVGSESSGSSGWGNSPRTPAHAAEPREETWETSPTVPACCCGWIIKYNVKYAKN